MSTLGLAHSLTGMHNRQIDDPKHPLVSPPIHSTTLAQPHSSLTQLLPTLNNGFLYWEEISTIFVVGFPVDMQEREFQNMFIFSPGFEAATLKIPSKDDEVDTTTLTTNYSKKQTIGFAKFKSRTEAMAAKDTMNGRMVDTEKGYVLKAEMAKKNLLTKRGSSSNQMFQLGQNSTWISCHDSLQYHQEHERQQQYHHYHHDPTPIMQSPTFLMETNYQRSSDTLVKRSTSPDHSSVYAAFHSVPAADQTPVSEMYSDLFASYNTVTSAATQSINSIATNDTSTVLSEIFNSTQHVVLDSGESSENISTNQSLSYSKAPYLLEKMEASSVPHPTLATGSTSSSPILQARKWQYEQHNHHNLHAYSSSLPPLSLSSTNRFLNDDQQGNQRLYSALNGLTINTNTIHSTSNTSLASTPTTMSFKRGSISSDLLSPASYQQNFTMMPITNPADQNPPCNTLYVGNLPQNTDEDELRQLFGKCIGYKRLSFRQKANGPMCFVEFDDIHCAAQVLQNLYGSPLSNSIKGGIRLSFSKNPLGVRRNSICNGGCSTKNDHLFLSSEVVPYYRGISSFGSP